MLARIEEEIRSFEREEMNAIGTLLEGLIDYAGLYPPASLDMGTAVRNYLEYRSGAHSAALGRFIVDVARLGELRTAAGPELASIKLSVIVAADGGFEGLHQACRELPIESIEIKCHEPFTITRLCHALPEDVERYFEINPLSACTTAIDALAAVNARAKLRMGGVSADAFPQADVVIRNLHTLADRQVPFKATAGLHHPIRSQHPLTYAQDSPQGMMHGFVNLFCTCAALYFRQSSDTALEIMTEQDARAFSIDGDAVGWRDLRWNVAQICQVRRNFFTSYGSCSFMEPIQDVEALGWL